MTVLLLFQNRIIQESLKHFLSVHFQHTEFAIASKLGFTITQLNAIAPNVMVIETDFYLNSTIDFIRFIRENNTTLPIIAISTQKQDEFAPELFRNGAYAFINALSEPTELILAIQNAIEGKKYISSYFAELLLKTNESYNAVPHLKLSTREMDVFRQMVVGASITKISDLLALNKNTVSTYRFRILKKMQMKSNIELHRYAVEKGIVQF
ncbi:MAG: LuxR C-terminal-related transcriptional regulator [Ferruginibacter sp.]